MFWFYLMVLFFFIFAMSLFVMLIFSSIIVNRFTITILVIGCQFNIYVISVLFCLCLLDFYPCIGPIFHLLHISSSYFCLFMLSCYVMNRFCCLPLKSFDFCSGMELVISRMGFFFFKALLACV